MFWATSLHHRLDNTLSFLDGNEKHLPPVTETDSSRAASFCSEQRLLRYLLTLPHPLSLSAPRIVLMATADARGHLMRGQLLYHGLRARGAEVSVLTTSDEGCRFLAEFGVPSEVLSRHYAVVFDSRQKMRTVATDLRVTTYFFLPWHMLRDICCLARRFAGADLIVNDSLHPAFLLMGGLDPWRNRAVHIYGWSLRESLEENFIGRLWGPIARFFRWWVRFGLSRARGRLVHDFAFPLPESSDPSLPEHQLPTPLALVDPSPGGAYPARKAAVYLNPHFSDPALAQALETTLQQVRNDDRPQDGDVFFLGEGYAQRPGWQAYAKDWIDIAARAKIIVSAPGMAALATAKALDKPVILIVTAQPEQRRNAERAAALGLRHRVVPWNEYSTKEQFADDFTEAYRALTDENAAYQRNCGQGDHPHHILRKRLDRWLDLLMAWASENPGQTRTAR